MKIKTIAQKNGFDCDDFERWLINYAGLTPSPDLKELDLEDGRVNEMVQLYSRYVHEQRFAADRKSVV